MCPSVCATCCLTSLHVWQQHMFRLWCACVAAVLEGMDLVKKIEGEGTGSGKPKKQVTIAKSGELSKKSWVSAS